MSFFMFIVLVALLIAFLVRRILSSYIQDSKWVAILRSKPWISNPWKAGLFLFGINTLIFGITALILFVLALTFIPYLHLLVMLAAIVLSLWIWSIMNAAWTDTSNKRWIMAFVGSSFYLILMFVCWILLDLLPSTHANGDNFMAGIGLALAAFASATAFIICLILTAYKKQTNPFNWQKGR